MNKSLVIKIGGRLQNDPRLPAALAEFARQAEKNICIIHGGGDKLTEMQRRLGHEPTFIHGKRVTRPEDMALVRMVLSGDVNKALVSALVGSGLRAIGISGEDNGFLSAQISSGGELGSVGAIQAVKTEFLNSLFADGYIPVISPVSRSGSNGAPLNVNADDAAYAIAEALGADELLFLSDVEGVLGESGLLPELKVSELDSLIAHEHINGGMLPKVRAAKDAVQLGVDHVRIAGIGYILGQDQGTLITTSV